MHIAIKQMYMKTLTREFACISATLSQCLREQYLKLFFRKIVFNDKISGGTAHTLKKV